MDAVYRFTAPLWIWKGDSAWHFVTLPFDQADEIDDRTTLTQGGFGSVKVRVTVGSSVWDTSLFPSSSVESYILPMKAAVRKKERLVAGEPVDVTIELI